MIVSSLAGAAAADGAPKLISVESRDEVEAQRMRLEQQFASPPPPVSAGAGSFGDRLQLLPEACLLVVVVRRAMARRAFGQ